MKKLIFAIAALLSMATMAYAVPALQLDISNGWYSTEGGTAADPGTITSTGDVFDLYALATTKSFTGGTYYLSAAVTPKTSSSVDAGSFDIIINGVKTTVNITDGMTYGTPPIERLQGSTAATDSGDLASHGIFETYFREFAFTFDTTKQIGSYDAQTRALTGGTIPTDGTGLYSQLFSIDTSNVLAGYEIHFDLYNEIVRAGGDLDRDKFAPFSHDAASGAPPVPEPGTIVLLGAGFLGLAAYGRKRIQK